jgi:hypothetical protein
MICSVKTVLTEDRCVVQKEKNVKNMLYVQYVHLMKGQVYPQETNPSSCQTGCYIMIIAVRIRLKKISSRGSQGN